MSDLLRYTTVMNVYQSWGMIKGADPVVAAEAIYKRLFVLSPQAKIIFGFGSGANFDERDIKANPAFLMHVHALFDMLDLAVNSLGPDLEPLADELVELGRRHRGRGVKPSHLRLMEQAFVEGITQLLKARCANLDSSDQEAWREMFQFLTTNMLVGLE